MSDDNSTLADPVIFSAVITPHRSLSAAGFAVLMLCMGAMNFAAGVGFLLAGAWPVSGFLGLNVLALYAAFRVNYRSARAYEEVTVTACELTVSKVSPRGSVRQWTLNPLWVQLGRIAHHEFGIERLFLVSRGLRLTIAGCLSPDEKASFAQALGAALGEARRGPTRTVLR
jgi:uncharacterized membrane protein